MNCWLFRPPSTCNEMWKTNICESIKLLMLLETYFNNNFPRKSNNKSNGRTRKNICIWTITVFIGKSQVRFWNRCKKRILDGVSLSHKEKKTLYTLKWNMSWINQKKISPEPASEFFTKGLTAAPYFPDEWMNNEILCNSERWKRMQRNK